MNSAYFAHLGNLSPLLSFVGWWFIPGYASKIALMIFYRLCPTRRPIEPASCLSDQSKTTTTTPPGTTTSKSDNQNKAIYNPVFDFQNSQYQRTCRKHRSIAHGFVISIYLGYSLIVAYQSQAGKNHYSTLGIPSNSLALDPMISMISNPSVSPPTTDKLPEVASLNDDSNLNSIKRWVIKGDFLDQSGLKSHWRKLARTLHPDKLTPPSHIKTESEINLWKSNVEAKFINMREAYETLSDTTKQWAYDRFGPTISQWKKCVTHREYLIEGLKQTAPFYGFSTASLLLIGSLKKSDAGTFWRWTLLLFLIGVELMILTSKSMSMSTIIISQIFPNRAQFELIELLRKIFIASSCMATQLSRILYPIEDEKKKKQSIDQTVEPLLGLVNQVQDYSGLANVELIKLIFNDLHPILRNPSLDNSANQIPSSSSNNINNPETLQTLESEDLRVQKLISEIKEKMLDTFCDLKLQSDANGQAAWIDAVNDSTTTITTSSS